MKSIASPTSIKSPAKTPKVNEEKLRFRDLATSLYKEFIEDKLSEKQDIVSETVDEQKLASD